MMTHSMKLVFGVLLAAAVAALFAIPSRTDAIPIFAQRYHFRCEVCHSVLPELNDFGNAFRDRGYRLPPSVPRHGTTVVAIRYQLEYEKDPAAGTRRWSPAGVVLANYDFGDIAAFVHYNLGAGGGPSALYLGYLADFNQNTKTIYRAGQFELPLPHSPGQRLDDLQPYGYEATKVGLNDLLLNDPRIGLEGERQVGNARVAFTASIGSFGGSAYGGKPVDTGVFTYVSHPEYGLYYTQRVLDGLNVGVQGITGVRAIQPTGKATFTDAYQRAGAFLSYDSPHVDLLAQQYWGHDNNADGFGNAIGSSGGYVRLRYWPLKWRHAFIGARYDAAANPIAQRDWVFYTGVQVTRHARIVLQQVQPQGGGPGHFGGALTIAAPWPWGY
jgi:hypothetical protein